MGREALPDAKTNEPRLYNLDQEIGEKTNLAAAHPEIVKELITLGDAMMAEIGGKNPTARRPSGKVARPTTLYPAIRREGQPKKRKKPLDSGNAL
jgi:hypothetical protein